MKFSSALYSHIKTVEKTSSASLANILTEKVRRIYLQYGDDINFAVVHQKLVIEANRVSRPDVYLVEKFIMIDEWAGFKLNQLEIQILNGILRAV